MASVNSQIVDAARRANGLSLSSAAELSMAETYIAAAHAIGLVMYNAAAVQQGTQQIAQASTATTCARIVKNGAQA